MHLRSLLSFKETGSALPCSAFPNPSPPCHPYFYQRGQEMGIISTNFQHGCRDSWHNLEALGDDFIQATTWCIQPAMDRGLNSVFESVDGFWGPTHTPFCEEGYLITPYIAEFWNTLSNLWFLVAAIPGMIVCIRLGLPKRYFLINFIVFILGLGSGFYHVVCLLPANCNSIVVRQ